MDERLFLGQTPYEEFPSSLTIPAELHQEFSHLIIQSVQVQREVASALVRPTDRIKTLLLGFGTDTQVVLEVYDELCFVKRDRLSDWDYHSEIMTHIRNRQAERVLEGLQYDGKSLYLLPGKVSEEDNELYFVSPVEKFFGIHHNHLSNGLPSFVDYWTFVRSVHCYMPTFVITSPVDSCILVKSKATPRQIGRGDGEFGPTLRDQIELEEAIRNGEPYLEAEKKVLLKNCKAHKIGMYCGQSSLSSFTRFT